MNATVISINPGTPTPAILFQKTREAVPAVKSRNSRVAATDAVRMLLGTRCDMKSSCLLVLVRLVFGGAFMAYGLYMLQGAFPLSDTSSGFIPEVVILIGALVSIGLLERIAALGGLALFSAYLANYAGGAVFPVTACLGLFVCLSLALAGPGKFSVDRFLQRRIERRCRAVSRA